MFKRMAAEALGISDIGVIVGVADDNKVDADDDLFSEDSGQIVFLIKSKKDEYCLTNLALIHVDGDSAISSARLNATTMPRIKDIYKALISVWPCSGHRRVAAGGQEQILMKCPFRKENSWKRSASVVVISHPLG